MMDEKLTYAMLQEAIKLIGPAPPEIIFSDFCFGLEDRIVERSWRERLFSRPWRPWRKWKTIEVSVPAIYKVHRPSMGWFYWNRFGFPQPQDREYIMAHTSFKEAINDHTNT
jgi:hypothetical protein